MHTGRLLSVSPSMPAPRGMYLRGGVPAWGYLLGGVPARGVYLPGGCTCLGGVPAQGGVPAWGCTCPGTPTVNRILDTRHWKYYLSPCPKLRLGAAIKFKKIIITSFTMLPREALLTVASVRTNIIEAVSKVEARVTVALFNNCGWTEFPVNSLKRVNSGIFHWIMTKSKSGMVTRDIVSIWQQIPHCHIQIVSLWEH